MPKTRHLNNDGPVLVVFGSPLPSSAKKRCKSLTPPQPLTKLSGYAHNAITVRKSLLLAVTVVVQSCSTFLSLKMHYVDVLYGLHEHDYIKGFSFRQMPYYLDGLKHIIEKQHTLKLYCMRVN